MENLSTLRGAIDDSLRQTDAYQQVRKLLQEHAQSTSLSTDISEQAALEQLLAKSLPVSATSPPLAPPQQSSVNMTGSLYGGVAGLQLRVTLQEGRNFEGGMNAFEEGGIRWALRVSLLFRTQRASTEVFEVLSDDPTPSLSGSFVFDLSPASTDSLHTLLETGDKDVVVCLTKEVLTLPQRARVSNQATGGSSTWSKFTLAGVTRVVLGTAVVDWRQALVSPGIPITVPLQPIDEDQRIEGAKGELVLCMDVTPVPGRTVPPLFDTLRNEAQVKEKATLCVANHRKEEAEFSRSILLSARAWWRELVVAQESSGYSSRPLKLFSCDETDGVRKFVCTFISPLCSGRLLTSPRQAARFVALIPVETRSKIGGSKSDTWASHFSFLSRRCGDAEAHALLLCSLLLGFGLNAYVALGTVLVSSNSKMSTMAVSNTDSDVSEGQAHTKGFVEVEHVWVMTFGTPKGGDGIASRVTSWDPITGTSEPFTNFASRVRLASLPQLFNHNQLLAAINPSIRSLSLRIDDANSWHSFKVPRNGHGGQTSQMDMSVASEIGRVNRGFALFHPNSPSTLAIAKLEENIEAFLRIEIERYRGEKLSPRLSTVFDDHLSFLLSPALEAYESERCIGVSFGNEDFQDSIRQVVPKGTQFKGYPACFGHSNQFEIWRHLTAQPASASTNGAASVTSIPLELIATRGTVVHFGVRVRVFPFPEGVCAVWVMLAVRARP